MSDDPKPDDSKLFGVSPGGWVVIISCFASSLILPGLNAYWQHELQIEQIRHAKEIESVKQSVAENAQAHLELASEVRSVGAFAARAASETEPTDSADSMDAKSGESAVDSQPADPAPKGTDATPE